LFSAWVVEHAGLPRLFEIPNRPNNPRTSFGGQRLFFGFLNYGDPENNRSVAGALNARSFLGVPVRVSLSRQPVTPPRIAPPRIAPLRLTPPTTVTTVWTPTVSTPPVPTTPLPTPPVPTPPTTSVAAAVVRPMVAAAHVEEEEDEWEEWADLDLRDVVVERVAVVNDEDEEEDGDDGGTVVDSALEQCRKCGREDTDGHRERCDTRDLESFATKFREYRCPICRQQMWAVTPDKVRVMQPCGHLYHAQCIRGLANICAICRAEGRPMRVFLN